MTDYTAEIKKFIQENFVPGTKEQFDYHFTNDTLIEKLKNVFPINGINDFDLSDTLIDLGYSRTILKSNCLILEFSKKLREKISEQYLEEFDVLEDLNYLEEKATLPTNYICWLFKDK